MMRIVFKGMLMKTKKHEKQLQDGFKEEGFQKPVIVGKFKTLPGQGGKGGRSEVVIDVDDKDVGRLAVHFWHLSGGFSWADDYVDNNREIIPEEAYKYFVEYGIKIKEVET